MLYRNQCLLLVHWNAKRYGETTWACDQDPPGHMHLCCISRPLSAPGGKRGRSASAYGSDVRGRIGVEELPELGLAVLRVPADPRRARGAVDHWQEVLRGGAGRGRGCGGFVRRRLYRGRHFRILQFHLRKIACGSNRERQSEMLSLEPCIER